MSYHVALYVHELLGDRLTSVREALQEPRRFGSRLADAEPWGGIFPPVLERDAGPRPALCEGLVSWCDVHYRAAAVDALAFSAECTTGRVGEVK
jgi:hypothetical protein